jgi:hypothetical protein
MGCSRLSAPSPEELADLMAETVRCALESGRAAASDKQQIGASAFQQYLDRATAIAEKQFQQEVEGRSFRSKELSHE